VGLSERPARDRRGNFAVRGAFSRYLPSAGDKFRSNGEWLGIQSESIRSFDRRPRGLLGQSVRQRLHHPGSRVIFRRDDPTFQKGETESPRRGTPPPRLGDTRREGQGRDPVSGDRDLSPTVLCGIDLILSSGSRRMSLSLPMIGGANRLSVAVDEHLSEVQTIGQGKDHLLRVEEVIATPAIFEERLNTSKALLHLDLTPEVLSFGDKDTRGDPPGDRSSEEGGGTARTTRPRGSRGGSTPTASSSSPDKRRKLRRRDLLTHYLPHIRRYRRRTLRRLPPPCERITFLTDQEIFGKRSKGGEESFFRH